VKIVTVVGARPQFVKAAAVSREIALHPDIREVIVHTGQHFDSNMSDIFFEEMQIPLPHYHLEINSIGHGAMTGRMLEKIEEVLLKEKPDYVMVYGDTNSTLAGALAAKKLHIRVVHVEAGLRSFNMNMPEEINRILTDRISDILCCPTDVAIQNLRKEGFDYFSCLTVKTGDVMLDAALYYAAFSSQKSAVVQTHGLAGREFALCTVHRAENTDDPDRLASIVCALNEVSREMPVVLPLHPRTRKIMAASDMKLSFKPIEPVGYFDMVELLKNTKVVLTDSGGLQKEAFFFGKPCVTLRDETEWVELVENGFNMLAGREKEKILSAYSEMKDKVYESPMDLYGKGRAAATILQHLR
jgi:UDP-GlcNAc3NAcA epimerase